MRAIGFALVLAVLLGAPTVQANAAEKNIVDTAVAAGSFKTLVAALKAADLTDTLKGKGPLRSSHRRTMHSKNFRREPWNRC